MPNFVEQVFVTLGQEMRPVDLNSYHYGLYGLVGNALCAITGSEAGNAQVDDYAMTAVGAGYVVTVGGTNQMVLVQRVLCDFCPATNLVFNPNTTGSNRTDTIYIQPADVLVDPFSVNFMDGSGNVTLGTGNNIRQTLTMQVVQQGGSPPAGFTAWANVVVPAMSTGVGTITILFDTMSDLITGGLGTVVESINSQDGVLTFESSDSSVDITNPSTGVFDFKANAPKPVREIGRTYNGYSTGINAQVVMPNDGRTYNLWVTFDFYTPHNGSSSIGAPSDPNSTNFGAMPGSGYNSGTIHASAMCTTVALGQTVQFPLTCFGGTIDVGIWCCDAIPID